MFDSFIEQLKQLKYTLTLFKPKLLPYQFFINWTSPVPIFIHIIFYNFCKLIVETLIRCTDLCYFPMSLYELEITHSKRTKNWNSVGVCIFLVEVAESTG